MSDDQHPPTLRDLAGDLPPLPDGVWEHTLAVAFDLDTLVDAELVPEPDELPGVPDDVLYLDLDTADLDAVDLDAVDLHDGVLLDHTGDRTEDPGDTDTYTSHSHGAGDHEGGDSVDGASGDGLDIDLGADIGDTDPGEYSHHASGHELDHELGVHPGDDLL